MKKLLPFFIVAIIVGAGAFYGGMSYGKSSSQPAGFAQRFQQVDEFNTTGRAGGRVAGQNAGFTGGEIIDKDATSITVKLQDGGSKIIFVSGSTPVTKSVQGSLNDLAIGENVMITGAANSDGSITAQSIQVRSNLSQQQQ